MRIAVDAMGGDRAPNEIIEGVRQFLETDDTTEIALVGIREQIEQKCENVRATIVDSKSVVGMHESPSSALKTKQDSSIALAAKLVKTGEADALISMGNSGATVAFATYSMGRLPNISKPAIVAPMPSKTGITLLLDVGATVDCKPNHLLQFAVMGSVLSRMAFNIESPRVGLLSIGEEPSKGNELTLETHKLLNGSIVNFVGNAEGTDISNGNMDVVVCDGFVGNVVLKYGEGLAEMFSSILKLETDEVLGDDVDDEHRGALWRETMTRVDYSAYGGALLMGVNGHCLIGHGRSGARAVASALKTARDAAAKCPMDAIEKALESTEVTA